MFTDSFTCNKTLTIRDLTSFLRALSEKTKSSIFVEKESRKVNAHSLLGLLSLGIKKGDKLKIYCDNKQALDFVKTYFI